MKPPPILPATIRALCAVVLATFVVIGCVNAGAELGSRVPLQETVPGGKAAGGAQAIAVVTLSDGLREPWGMDFLPDGSLLVTEKGGALKRLVPGDWSATPVNGVPAVASAGQGGLMDVVVHPQFADTHWIYLSYAVEESGAYSTRVSRVRLRGDTLEDLQILFTARPFYTQRRHFGSRLLLDGGHLYITVGDRGNRASAQSLATHNGKVLRVTEAGEIPVDNPFTGRDDALPEIWSFGHRNPQGIARHPYSGELWVSEHGPQGGDEINVLRRGANYGWPVITYGEEYGGGKIGEGTRREGMEQPLRYWVPSIGSSGIDFYQGSLYPGWQSSLLVAGLRQPRISRLQLEGKALGGETVLLANLGLRIRDVQLGPDGLVYALAGGSRLIRLEPTSP